MKRLLFLSLIIILAGCNSGNLSKRNLSGTIKIDGSSTVYLLTEAISSEFTATYPNVTIDLQVSGTGGGFDKFCKGETDINNASRVINENEKRLCDSLEITFTEIPVAYDGIVLVTNKNNVWLDYISTAELKTLWMDNNQNPVTTWDQVRPTWPKEKIRLFGPGKASGTFDFFTEEILGKETACRTDYTPSEDDNVLVEGVVNDVNSLGYFGLAYYEENKDRLKLIPISNKNNGSSSDAVFPSKETIENYTYKPLSRILYIYVSDNSAERPEIMEYIRFYITRAGEKATAAGYVPLSDIKYKRISEALKPEK